MLCQSTCFNLSANSDMIGLVVRVTGSSLLGLLHSLVPILSRGPPTNKKQLLGPQWRLNTSCSNYRFQTHQVMVFVNRIGCATLLLWCCVTTLRQLTSPSIQSIPAPNSLCGKAAHDDLAVKYLSTIDQIADILT